MRAITLITLALFLLSCVPTTPYRREALVPGPQPPPYRGEPLGTKHVEIQAQVAGSEVIEEIPDVHDPALWIPEFQINASAMIGAAKVLDLGLLLTYAHGSFARASAEGTPPMPDDGKNLFAVGPQVGISGKSSDGGFFGGGYFSLQYVRIPWSEWTLVSEDTAEYRFHKSDFDDNVYYRIGLYFGGRKDRPEASVYRNDPDLSCLDGTRDSFFPGRMERCSRGPDMTRGARSRGIIAAAPGGRAVRLQQIKDLQLRQIKDLQLQWVLRRESATHYDRWRPPITSHAGHPPLEGLV